MGQTRRRMQVRWKEHEAALRLNHPENSAVAKHCIDFPLGESRSNDSQSIYGGDQIENLYEIRSKNAKFSHLQLFLINFLIILIEPVT